MNTMRILIGATFAILVAALAYKFIEDDNQKKDQKLAELEEKIANMQNSQVNQPYVNPNLYNQPVGQTPPYTPPAPVHPDPTLQPKPLPEKAQTAEELAEIKRLKAKVAAQEKEIEETKKEAEFTSAETNAIKEEINKRTQSEEARAYQIKQAKVFAIVKDYDAENQLIQLELSEGVQLENGRHLCIRRGIAGGIPGRVQITTIQDNVTAFADPIPGSFKGRKVDVRIGDELIIDVFK